MIPLPAGVSRRYSTRPAWTAVIACLVLAFSTGPALAVEAGDVAPDFELAGSDGRTYRLSDYRGVRAVVVAWFPRAYTRGCTIECKSLAENGHLIREYDVAYFMASVDPLEDNVGFAAEQQADFPLLSDPTREAAAAYGVLSERGYAKRHTFYIGADGVVMKVDRTVVPETSAQDMAATLGELGVVRLTEEDPIGSGSP